MNIIANNLEEMVEICRLLAETNTPFQATRKMNGSWIIEVGD